MFVIAKKVRKLDLLELLSIICTVFYTSIRYKMVMCILVENVRVHLLIEILRKIIEVR